MGLLLYLLFKFHIYPLLCRAEWGLDKLYDISFLYFRMAEELVIRHEGVGCSFGVDAFFEGRRVGFLDVVGYHIVSELSSFLFLSHQLHRWNGLSSRRYLILCPRYPLYLSKCSEACWDRFPQDAFVWERFHVFIRIYRLGLFPIRRATGRLGRVG